MQFKTWELSNVVPKTDLPLSEGEHLLYVVDASYNPMENIYAIRFKSLTNEGEESVLKFYLMSRDNLSYNNAVVGTLNSLTKAVGGEEQEGILSPDDVTGMLVKANVKLSKPKEYNGEMRQYPAIYDFMCVSRTEYDIAKSEGYELKIQYLSN